MASFRVRYGVNTRRAQARGSQGYPKPFLRMAGCKSNVILILHGQKTKVSTITYRSSDVKFILPVLAENRNTTRFDKKKGNTTR
jgi:hypothetical protein